MRSGQEGATAVLRWGSLWGYRRSAWMGGMVMPVFPGGVAGGQKGGTSYSGSRALQGSSSKGTTQEEACLRAGDRGGWHMTGLVGGRQTPERRAGGRAGLGFDRTGLSWSQDGGREADVWPELRARLTGTVAGGGRQKAQGPRVRLRGFGSPGTAGGCGSPVSPASPLPPGPGRVGGGLQAHLPLAPEGDVHKHRQQHRQQKLAVL